MTDRQETPLNMYKKIHIADVVTFARKNIPTVDKDTLEKFLELVNVSGTFGTITSEQIMKRIRQMLRYVPDSCPHSLLVVADLLELNTMALPEIRIPALASGPTRTYADVPSYSEPNQVLERNSVPG